MSLDVTVAYSQIRKLAGCIEDAQQIKRELSQYRKDLNSAWTGKEMTYFNRTIDNLSSQITAMSSQMEALKRDIDQAITEILEEEAAEQAAASSST